MDERVLILLIAVSVSLGQDEDMMLKCPIPGVERGSLRCTDGNNIGSNCDIECESGYELLGMPSLTCSSDASWSMPIPICEMPCEPRGKLRGGRVRCTEGSKHGSVCTATCKKAYDLVGEAVSTCVQGLWDNPLPICELKPCEAQTLENGTITCTNGWNVRSFCTFECDDGYGLVPRNQQKNRCRRGQRWTPSTPCCSRPCPPYALLDIVVVLDSSTSAENWVILTAFVRNIIRSVMIGPDDVNFAIFRYNRVVDTDSQIYLNSYPEDKDGLLEAFNRLPYDGSGTFTGNALRHALEVSLSPANGNRPDAKDLVFVITDGNSADDVKIPADNLRAAGAKVIVLGMEPPRGQLDVEQLMDIAGQEQNLVRASGGFGSLDENFSLVLMDNMCPKPCE